MTSQVKVLDDVPARGLCTGCGTCLGVCAADAVRLVRTRKGQLAPRVDRRRCTGCGVCLRVCPGYRLDFARLAHQVHGRQAERAELGHVRAIYAGHATDMELRRRTQSGGMVSALLIFMLERGLIDGAVVTRWRADDPLATETFVARTRTEVLSAAFSKYIPVPAAGAIRQVLQQDGRYAFVGTSCQIHGLRQAEQVLARLRQRIVLRLGLHCLGVFNFLFPEDMLARLGVARDELVHFFFRSKEPLGWPCHLRVEARDGRSWDIHGKYSRLAPRPYYTPFRCLLCFDKLNELSDISFGDCRIARHYGVRRLAEAGRPDNLGQSDVIVRSPAGQAVLEAAAGAGVVALADSTPEEIRSTTKVSAKKLGVEVYAMLARLVGRPTPRYDVRYVPATGRHQWWLRGMTPLSLASASVLAACCRAAGHRLFHAVLRRVPLPVLRQTTGLLEGLTGPGRLHDVRLEARVQPAGRPTAAEESPVALARRALERLWTHVHAENLAGYDKFDALNSPILRACTLGRPALRMALTQAVVRSPLAIDLRPILRIPKERSPSRVARFISAYVTMHALEPEAGWLERAAEPLAWLRSKIAPGYSGAAWGYNYPWQNRGFYAPRGMPNLVVTRYCGEAFLDMYEATGRPECLETARSAVDFILKDLPVLSESERRLTLGYVPTRVGVTVVNINAQAAAFLARVGAATGEAWLLKTARRLMNYVESQKTAYHAWYYTDPPRSRSLITHDNYHTANILDAILAYTRHSGDMAFMPSYHQGLAFYRRHLFLDDGTPKWMNNRVYPNDIRGAAGGIVTFARAGAFDRDALEFAWRIAQWAIRHMQAPYGGFYYQRTGWQTKRYSLMGWCNSAMAYALAQLLYWTRQAAAVKEPPA